MPECDLCKAPLATGTCTHIEHRDGQVLMSTASWNRLVTELNELRSRDVGETGSDG